MIKYVFLFCCFLLGLVCIFRIYIYFFSIHSSHSKKQSSNNFFKRVFPISFILFTILLLTFTSVTYYFVGRSDLIETQLSQNKLETNFSKLNEENPKVKYETEIYALFEKLKQTLVARPTDLKGFKLLVATSISLKEYRVARIAQETVIQLREPDITAQEYILYFDLAFLAAGGRVSLEASKMLKKAEVLYPRNEILIFFKALEHFEKREYQKAVKIFYFLQESDKIDNEKLEFLREKLSQMKIIP